MVLTSGQKAVRPDTHSLDRLTDARAYRRQAHRINCSVSICRRLGNYASLGSDAHHLGDHHCGGHVSITA